METLEDFLPLSDFSVKQSMFLAEKISCQL